MKKRRSVALFSNGWGIDFLRAVGRGVFDVAKQENIDIFLFIDYAAHGDLMDNLHGEVNIFKLPDLSEFDGAIIAGSSFNSKLEGEYIEAELKRTGIPAVSLEYDIEGADKISVDDYAGMCQVVEHLITEHNVKSFVYMGGIHGHEADNIRFKAVTDVAYKYGLCVEPENILYADFTGTKATVKMNDWAASHEKMVDAVICANDNMALGVCNWLENHGYNVPGDVKVTGFDCTGQGMLNNPSITSVDRAWYPMGKRSMELLVAKMNGTDASNDEELGAVPVFGGSCCGNLNNAHIPADVLERIENQRKKTLDGVYSDQHFRHMYIALRKSSTAKELYDSFETFFKYANRVEGDQVMICLNQDFFENNGNLEMGYMDGYPEKMEVVSAYGVDGIDKPMMMSKNETIFAAAERNEEPGVYIFVPLRNDGIALGYAMLTSGFDILNNSLLYIWTRHGNQNLELVRSNVKIASLTRELEALSIKDSLTGLYNRNGIESIVYPRLATWQNNGGQGVLMFADMDRLKRINDTYGHNSGDLAINTLGQALRDNLGEEYHIGRLGGDEFIVVGLLTGRIDSTGLAKELEDVVAKASRESKLPFEVTVSIGAIQLAKGEAFDEKTCIEKVDAQMYRIKKMHHERYN